MKFNDAFALLRKWPGIVDYIALEKDEFSDGLNICRDLEVYIKGAFSEVYFAGIEYIGAHKFVGEARLTLAELDNDKWKIVSDRFEIIERDEVERIMEGQETGDYGRKGRFIYISPKEPSFFAIQNVGDNCYMELFGDLRQAVNFLYERESKRIDGLDT